MAPSLRGAVIVGHYNRDKDDYETHNRIITIDDNGFNMADDTFPYGFVDINANVWFQKFLDDNSIEREYLCTEGYLWTGAYPECERVLESGNAQSMELDEKSLQGHWAKQDNSSLEFFIINEAVISKLCILGESVEPCFEGASIGSEFSLSTDFIEKLQYMLNEFKVKLEGGENSVDEQVTAMEDYKANDKAEEKEEEAKETETAESKDEQSEAKSEDKNDDEKEEKAKTKHSVEDYEEYQQLKEQYDTLSQNYSLLEEEAKDLRAFKAQIDKQEKQKMIDSFYMLSDEDKKDVVDNIDTYSLADIEAKLSIICVRNKVSFAAEQEPQVTAYSVAAPSVEYSAEIPEWIKALDEVQNIEL